MRINLAQLCMEGSTIHFFNSLLDDEIDLTWDRLKDELLNRYDGIGVGDVFEQLSDLQQKGSVEDYIRDFEFLIAQVPRLPDNQYLGYFLHGLKEEIRGRVRSFVALGPIPRSKLMHVTRAVEKELGGREGGSGQSRGYRSGFCGGSTRSPN